MQEDLAKNVLMTQQKKLMGEQLMEPAVSSLAEGLA